MSQFNFVDALQMGGASATIMGVMFLAYKAVTLIVNHRCRSECCSRVFSLGILWEAVTPLQHRHASMEEAMRGRHLLDGFQLEEKHDDNQSVSSRVSQELAPAKSKLTIKNKSQQSATAEDMSSPVQSHLSSAPPTAPS